MCYVSQRSPLQSADFFIAVSVVLHSFSPSAQFRSADHGFCDACMRGWLKSNRVGPQRRLRQLKCPTCRKPARESDLGRMFVETVVLNEDTEYQTRLVNTITDQINSARDSVRAISPASSAVQVNGMISAVVQSRGVLSESRYAENEPMVKAVMEVSLMPFTTCV